MGWRGGDGPAVQAGQRRRKDCGGRRATALRQAGSAEVAVNPERGRKPAFAKVRARPEHSTDKLVLLWGGDSSGEKP
jgi:hypothetical protein